MSGDIPHMAQSERRLSRRAIIFWRSLRRNNTIPSMQDFRPERLPVPWGRCFLLEVNGHADDPLFDYVGDELTHDAGGGLAGRPVSSAPADTLLQRTCRGWRESCAEVLPVLTSGGFRHRAGHLVLHRSVLLPFGHGDGAVDYLVGATSHRMARENLQTVEPESLLVIDDD